MIRSDQEVKIRAARRARSKIVKRRVAAIAKILNLNAYDCESEALELWCSKMADEAVARTKQ